MTQMGTPAATGEWECMECGYVEDGAQTRRPKECPECGAPSEAFEFFAFEEDDWDDDEDSEDEDEDLDKEDDVEDFEDEDEIWSATAGTRRDTGPFLIRRKWPLTWPDDCYLSWVTTGKAFFYGRPGR